jgi:hypothetical protein
MNRFNFTSAVQPTLSCCPRHRSPSAAAVATTALTNRAAATAYPVWLDKEVWALQGLVLHPQRPCQALQQHLRSDSGTTSHGMDRPSDVHGERKDALAAWQDIDPWLQQRMWRRDGVQHRTDHHARQQQGYKDATVPVG